MKHQKQSSFFFAALLIVLSSIFAFAAPPKIKDLKPTVMLISIDGFRPDYLEKYQPEILNELARKGVRAKWMTPVFPSLTFPNHYSIATGLYAENHGIVGNNMYDPEFKATFGLGIREEVQNGRWWQGEPIWVTAEKQGQRAGAFFFPGTEAEIAGFRPTFWKTYDSKVPIAERVDTVLSWLDLPQSQRPTFYTVYFSAVDSAGHDHSPDSPEVAKAVGEVDAILGRLVEGLKQRGVFKKVNLVIVSDHGMASVDPTNVVFLDEYFDAGKTEQIVWSGTLTNIFPKAGEEDAIFQSLAAKPIEHARCYRKSEIPQRFRFQNNRRIAPVICLADEGWLLTSQANYETRKKENRIPNHNVGVHGYDNELPSMRALFVAHGEAFKKKTIVQPFENVSVYNMMTEILGLTGRQNDGNMKAARAVLKNKN